MPRTGDENGGIKLKHLLGNDSVIIRFFSLYVLGLILFFISWTIAYYLLPEGFLQGFGILGKLAGDKAADTLVREFIHILGLNLIGVSFIIIGNYILRVKYFSFGYLVPLAWMIMYGIILGTNSFSIQLEEAMAPTLAVFSRSGLYEMMAAVLVAAATNSISVNYSENISSKSKPIPKNERAHLKKEQWIAICIAILILAGAALREAYMIVNIS
ncbi:hypothetical protein [Gudongella sp. DL1XJH-153]|uniref:hypothetical protein n=1 Tax=Gudongella sp. DL1XJH-153 TaxID=3409804 RepID=UPI003BB5D299